MNSSIAPGGPGTPERTALSAHLGTLAGRLFTAPQAVANASSALPPALIALLQSLERRRQAAEQFKATHFIHAD